MTQDQSIEHAIIGEPAVLLAKDLCFHYPECKLFDGWSACIRPGVTLVRGGEGKGKTTLLRLLAGELAAHSGQLQVNRLDLSVQPSAYRQQVFWTDPRSDACDQMKVADYFDSLHRAYPEFDARALPGLIEGLSLTPHLDKFLYMLSAGSKRKVWLAAAFASGAAVTLLDEPFAALDRMSIDFVLRLLQDATGHARRAWIIADYKTPGDTQIAAIIDLGE